MLVVGKPKGVCDALFRVPATAGAALALALAFSPVLPVAAAPGADEWPDPLGSPRNALPRVPSRWNRSEPAPDSPSRRPSPVDPGGTGRPVEPRLPLPCVERVTDSEVRAAYEVAADLRRILLAPGEGADEPVYRFVARLREAARRTAWASTAQREALVQAAFYRDWPEPTALERLARAQGGETEEAGRPALARLLGANARLAASADDAPIEEGGGAERRR